MEQNAIAKQLHVLEIAAGYDVIRAVSDFANRYKVDVSVITAYGLVCNLTISRAVEHPQTPLVLAFQGVFDLLSLKGSFYGSSAFVKLPSPLSTRHVISVAGLDGQIFGGIVAGNVMARTTVFLGVSVIRETDYIKLPLNRSRPLAFSNN